MNLPKLLLIVSVILFGIIGTLAFFKKEPINHTPSFTSNVPLEIELDQNIQVISPARTVVASQNIEAKDSRKEDVQLPDANRIDEFFNTSGMQLPIVETLTYKSRVAWLKGRPAWLSDYASYYKTSRHFIARSLNGEPDYFHQELAEGDQFTVLRKDENIEFYLLVDTSRCRMWFYYIDPEDHQKVLLKTYSVGLGRLDSSKTSGLLTPLGVYTLGDKIAIYKPKVMGIYQGKKTEMLSVFGTRWIPFEKEVKNCTAPARGFGIHGTPWKAGASGELLESAVGIDKYDSDGCIRLLTPDVEELFAIIITKPTTIEIVRDFYDAHAFE